MKFNIQTRTYGAEGDFSNNTQVWQQLLYIVSKAGLTPLAVAKHEFYPKGLSGVVIIGESHVAIHTYPEYNQALIVVSTCGLDASGHILRFSMALQKIWKSTVVNQ